MSDFSQLQNDEEASIRQRIDSLTSDPLRRNVLQWALLSPPEEVEKPAPRRKISLRRAQNDFASTHASSSECVISADSPLYNEHKSTESVVVGRTPDSEEWCPTPRSDTMKKGVGKKNEGVWADEDLPTTIKMRNLPKSYTNSHLIDLLHHYKYLPHVDFLYVFIRSIQRNVGVAVINFTSHTEALQFLTQFQGFDQWHLTPGNALSSSKPIGPTNGPPSFAKCSLQWNDTHQGRDQLINYYRDGPIMHQPIPNDFKPLLFKNGTPQEFPSPLRRVRGPRRRLLHQRILQKRILRGFEERALETSDLVQNQPNTKKAHHPAGFRAQNKRNYNF